MSAIFEFSPRIVALPVVHGSGDCALEVRRRMLGERWDCVAVPLPPSFAAPVRQAIGSLPAPALVLQEETAARWSGQRDEEAWRSDGAEEEEDEERRFSYVPIDPCQPVIAALRIAEQERMATAFIDLETDPYLPLAAVLPDPYALKQVTHERFAAAVLAALPPLPPGQPRARAAWMAQQLRRLERKHQRILFVCSFVDWPWIREAYRSRTAIAGIEPAEPADPQIVRPDPKTHLFWMGELPFVTGLYERARSELEADENLSIDGVKELLIATRDRYLADFQRRARKITPHMLRTVLKYARNLTLQDRRLTPDTYTLVVAAQQVCGDGFAVHLAETLREYPYDSHPRGQDLPPVKVGIGKVQLPDGEIVAVASRLPGVPLTWRSFQIKRRPEKPETQQWRTRWNPFAQCSWPPEDELIESFRQHVFDRAKQILGAELVKTEKFTTSIKDGIDIRDTLRNWHTGDIYVRDIPPSRGKLDCVVMLFDAPADPREYPWRTTWYAEHEEESTLAFYATDFSRELVGPGIALATYGGALFLYPPLAIPDIWHDRALDFTTTLEERLVAAGCLYSRARQVALLAAQPPGAGWRQLARRFGKRLVHVPLGQFGDSTIQQLRMVHVLNGREVRSYAADFIRRA